MADDAPRLLGRAAVALFTVLCLSAVPAVGQEEAVAGGEAMRFVCLDENRRAFASEATPGGPDGLDRIRGGALRGGDVRSRKALARLRPLLGAED